MCDDQVAIRMTNILVHHDRTKYIEVVRLNYEPTILIYVPTKQQLQILLLSLYQDQSLKI